MLVSEHQGVSILCYTVEAGSCDISVGQLSCREGGMYFHGLIDNITIT